jgi:hypothetical protein
MQRDVASHDLANGCPKSGSLRLATCDYEFFELSTSQHLDWLHHQTRIVSVFSTASWLTPASEMGWSLVLSPQDTVSFGGLWVELAAPRRSLSPFKWPLIACAPLVVAAM